VGAAAAALAVFGAAAVAFAAPAPLGLTGYAFPAVGAVAVIGRVARAACVAAVAVGTPLALGARRLDRRSRLAAFVAVAGVVLIALGEGTNPAHVVSGFGFAVDSPLALPNFEAAAASLRVAGYLTCVAAFGVALSAAVERFRSIGVSARGPLRLGLGMAVLLLASALPGFVLGVGPLMAVGELLAVVGVPVAIGAAGERVVEVAPPVAIEVVRRREREQSFELLSQRALTVARLGSALWGVALFWAFRDTFSGATPAVVLAAMVATAVAAVANVMVRPLVSWRALSRLEVVVAASVMVVDGAAGRPGHLFSGASGLGGPWPMVVVAAAGAANGPALGALAGAVVGVARVAGVVVSGQPVFAAQAQGLAGGFVGLVVVGLAAGALLSAMREAETQIASARAREAVARRLHDGVLQALAIVRRRSEDAEIVAVVDDADRDLRSYLDYGDSNGELDLEGGVRQAVDGCERRFGLRVSVVVDELPRRTAADVVATVSGGVSEALANVAKHSGVKAATVFVGSGKEIGYYVTVTDRGTGFDPETVAPGRGITGSVAGRMRAVGGSATVRPLAGGGTQVTMCLP
jgi:signal transduction histidine kinase